MSVSDVRINAETIEVFFGENGLSFASQDELKKFMALPMNDVRAAMAADSRVQALL